MSTETKAEAVVNDVMGMMDAATLSPRDIYIQECQSVIRDYTENHELRITYVKKKIPRLIFPISKIPHFEERSKLMRSHPEANFRTYTELWMDVFGKLENKQELEPGDSYEPLVYETIRRLEKFRAAPHLGVVVSFVKDGKYVGWSLCNTSKKDRFNKYIGIRKAIDRANEISIATSMSFQIPHTCMPFVSKALNYLKSKKLETA